MESVAHDPSRSQIEIKAPAKAIGRFLYVDNIRVFLTMLVIAHHLMVIYAGSGGWIYHEGRQDEHGEDCGDSTDLLPCWEVHALLQCAFKTALAASRNEMVDW